MEKELKDKINKALDSVPTRMPLQPVKYKEIGLKGKVRPIKKRKKAIDLDLLYRKQDKKEGGQYQKALKFVGGRYIGRKGENRLFVLDEKPGDKGRRVVVIPSDEAKRSKKATGGELDYERIIRKVLDSEQPPKSSTGLEDLFYKIKGHIEEIKEEVEKAIEEKKVDEPQINEILDIQPEILEVMPESDGLSKKTGKPKRKQSTNQRDWMQYVNRVSALPSMKGKSRWYIMQKASGLRKEGVTVEDLVNY